MSIKNKNIPRSIMKDRVTNSRTVIGTIPNQADNFSKLMALANYSNEARTNFVSVEFNINAGEVGSPTVLGNKAVYIVTSTDGTLDGEVQLPKPIPFLYVKVVNKVTDTTLTITAAENCTIDGAANTTVAPFTGITFVGDETGTNWSIIY